MGDVVRAHSEVDGETLESQPFELPPQGGVRVALVSGIGAGVPPAGSPTLVLPTPGAAATGDGAASRWWVLSVVFGTLGIGIWVAGARRLLRSGTAEVPRGRGQALDDRETLFDELVTLELEHTAGRAGQSVYRTTRAALIDRLVAIDSAAQDDEGGPG